MTICTTLAWENGLLMEASLGLASDQEQIACQEKYFILAIVWTNELFVPQVCMQFIRLFFEYLLNISLVPGALFWAKDMTKMKVDRNSCPHGIYTPVGEKKKTLMQYFQKWVLVFKFYFRLFI